MVPENPYEIVLLVVSWIALVWSMVIVVKWDERRLDDEALERAWPPAGRDSAIIGLSLLGSPLLGLFALFFHFFRTRSRALWPPTAWSLKGLGLGVAAICLVFAFYVLVAVAVAWMLGL